MKRSKVLLATALVLVLLAGGGAVYAATASSPLEILSNVTGDSVDAIVESREDGETLGSIAAEKDVLEEFQKAMLENRKAVVQERVEEGVLTQEEADEYLAIMAERMETCDGTGVRQGDNLGQQFGMGMGRGSRNGDGTQSGFGQGFGMRNGR